MNKIFGLLSVLAVVAACGSETVDVSAPRTRPVPDTEGCYDVGQDPHTFACTPGCNYLEGSLRPFHGITTGICVLACHADGHLVPVCFPREDAGTDASDASTDNAPVDTTDVAITEDAMPVDIPHVRCMSDTECDDRDEATTDRCDLAGGVCHHTRTVVEAPFDPVMRQMVRSLCEQPIMCSTGNAVELRAGCGGGEFVWMELGYPLDVAFNMPPPSGRIHIAPRLSAGDPRDSFRVRAFINASRTPVIDRVMSVAEIERGVDVSVTTAGDVLLLFLPAGDSLLTTTLQWDLPVGRLTDGEGRNLSTCLQAGPFVSIPQHGFLHLQESVSGRLECVGTVLRPDSLGGPRAGWAREVSDTTLYYIDFPPSPFGRVYSFATAREAVSWIESPIGLQTMCTTVLVLPDHTFSSLTGSARVNIGVRPGAYVEWSDATGIVHQGIADQRFSITETEWPIGVPFTGTLYGTLVGMPTSVTNVTDMLGRYRMSSSPLGTALGARGIFLAATMNHYND